MTNDIFTLDENDNAAIRTVGVNPGSAETNSPSVFTEDENGNACIRVTGSGGSGDQHNLGYYTTQAALEEAHPTAEAGDWAIVGATDTVWIWDEDNSAWVDSDQKGQVTSVNNQTGAVTLGINDVAPTQTGHSGYVLGTDGFVAGWVKPEQVQRSAMPQASEEEEGEICQFVGTTDANYTNGYFYKNVATQGVDSATISQTTGSGLSDLAVNVDTFVAEEQPTQSGNTSFAYVSTPETLSPTVFTISQATITIDPSLFLSVSRQFSVDDGWDWSNLAHIRLLHSMDEQYPIDADFLDENDNIIDTVMGLTLEAWGITIDGTLTEFDPLVMNYIQGSSEWTKNGTPVTLSDYGISYSGTPNNGDVLTVAYTEGAVTYSWERTDVQPAGATGIVWASRLDLQAGSWESSPYIKIAGGLAEGEYEFYTQTKNYVSDSHTPLSEMTFRIKLKVGQNHSYRALVYPVIDGQYYPKAKLQDLSTSTGLFVKGSDIYIALNLDLFATNIPSQTSASLAVEDCFKISAIKNLNTLEEIIPEASFEQPSSYDGYYNIVFYIQTIDYIITPNNYWGEWTADFANVEYININDFSLNYPSAGEVCISFSTDLENQFSAKVQYLPQGDVRITVQIATGVFSGVEFYKNNNENTVMLKLNSPTPRTGTLNVYMSVFGALSNRSATIGIYDANASFNLSLLPIDEVGCTITPRTLGSVWQYTKDTNANYTKGYFYEATGTPTTIPASMNCQDYGGTGIDITCNDPSGFISWLASSTGYSTQTIESAINDGYREFVYNPSNYYWSWNWGPSGYNSQFESFFTFNPALQGSIDMIVTLIPEHTEIINQAWVQYNTQPSATTPSTMPTLTVAGWSSNTQTVTVNGVTTTNNVLVAPAPASSADWTSAGVICTAQGTDSLTFTCQTTPSNDITVNVCILG